MKEMEKKMRNKQPTNNNSLTINPSFLPFFDHEGLRTKTEEQSKNFSFKQDDSLANRFTFLL
jgi:hypothetical protein